MNTSVKTKAKLNINDFQIILPVSGKGKKEFDSLFSRRKKQVIKTVEKLKKNPLDFNKKGIEKINDNSLGEYTIRVSKGDRIFYDVDVQVRKVYILRCGKHDLYKLL